ncbi:MAG: ATP-dependent DNA ligase [Nocardioidaceae bacterium]
MLLHDIVVTSQIVGATRSRLAKCSALAGLLSAAQPDDIEIVVAYLAGELRQRKTGLGWRSLRALPPPVDDPTLPLAEVDRQFERISQLFGAGSAGQRAQAVHDLFSRATTTEQDFLRRLVLGEIRQGALESLMLDAVAAASSVPPVDVRRAVMLRGATGPVARVALTSGADAVRAFSMQVSRPIQPMLASTAPDVGTALAKLRGDDDALTALIDTKLDGIRIQVHKNGRDVRIFTRTLDDITDRLPEVVTLVAALPARELVLDGEAMTLDAHGRARPFQETSARTATSSAIPDADRATRVTPFFFDCLYADGHALIDLPLRLRLAELDRRVPPDHRLTRLITTEPAAAEQFFSQSVAAGHEGVMVKALDSLYAAGRRGSAWIKVKPRHTLDLVVLAVEEGSGRPRGLLSNIHLGARDPLSEGWVMLGKTFKGMTDTMLRWQTERFLELEISRQGHVVHVRPEQVVEIAFDGLQRSTRYPGGLALRFARVLRYRDDKPSNEADTIDEVRRLASHLQSR